MQLQYRVAIEESFARHMETVRKAVAGVPLSIAVDVCYDTPDLMAACLHKTYGVPEKAFSKSRKSLELDKVAKNLSGDKNPGSRLLLAEMKSRKNTGENFKDLIINFFNYKNLVLESI
uniref:Uncharacterized protein n=1 Tax=Magallana gigas TaxID=29159 RepID=K1QQG4_MAGGI